MQFLGARKIRARALNAETQSAQRKDWRKTEKTSELQPSTILYTIKESALESRRAAANRAPSTNATHKSFISIHIDARSL